MKLLVCDVEGTIFKASYKIEGTDYASTMWQPLAKKLGDAAVEEEKETHKKWDNKEYNNYIEWVEATVEIHKKYNLHIDIFNSLLDEAEYNDGVIEFFNKLDRKKYIPILISGGFQELVRKAQKDLKINYGYGACEYNFDKNTGFLASHTMTPCDFDGKYQYVNALFDVYDLNPKKDWLFIGDGKNDVHIANKAPLAYSINAHDELAKIVTLNAQNFNEIYDRMIEDEKNIHVMHEEILSPDPNSTNNVDKNEEYNKLKNEHDAVISHAVNVVSELVKLEAELVKTKKILDTETTKRVSAENAKVELEIKQAELENELKSSQLSTNVKGDYGANNLSQKDLELIKIRSEIECMNKLLDESSIQIKEKELNLKFLSGECKRLQEENSILKKNEESAMKKVEKEDNHRRKKIKNSWALYFKHFLFTTDVIHEAAKLSHDDLMRLEEELLRLQEAPDPKRLRTCNLAQTSNEHLRFHLSDGVRARLDYRILSGQQHKVEIVKFYPRKNFDRVIKNSMFR